MVSFVNDLAIRKCSLQVESFIARPRTGRFLQRGAFSLVLSWLSSQKKLAPSFNSHLNQVMRTMSPITNIPEIHMEIDGAYRCTPVSPWSGLSDLGAAPEDVVQRKAPTGPESEGLEKLKA